MDRKGSFTRLANLGFWLMSLAAGLFAQNNTESVREATAKIGPTEWSVSSNSPPCELQVYVGRVNTTREASSCVRVCIDRTGLPSAAKVISLDVYSREEHADQWLRGALPWSAWEQQDQERGCAVFKNWSNNRFREAKIVVNLRTVP